MLTTAIAFSILLNQATEPKPVTLQLAAAPVSQIVAEIARATGRSLNTRGQLGDIIIALSVKDVPESKLLDNLATVALCEWQQGADGSLTLIRSATKEASAIRLDQAETLEYIRAALAKKAKRFREPLDESKMLANLDEIQKMNQQMDASSRNREFYKRFSELRQQAPDQYLLWSLVSRIDAGAIARLKPGERVVFSTHPTRMQRPLGTVSLQAIAESLRLSQVWRDANNRSASAAGPEDLEIGSETPVSSNPQDQRPAVIELAIGYDAMGVFGGYRIRVRVLNAKGTPILDAADNLPRINQNDEDMEFEAFFSKPGNPLEFSDETKLLITELEKMTAAEEGSATPHLSSALTERFLNPERYEPLATVPSDAVHSLAKAEKRNVVARIPDSLLMAGFFVIGGGGFSDQRAKSITVEAFYKLTEFFLAYRRVDAGDWILLNQAQVEHNRGLFTPRAPLGAFLRRLTGTPYPQIEDYAEYATLNESGGYDSIGFALRSILDADSPFMSNAASSNTGLRLFGSLTPTQRQSMLRGGTIPFQVLTAKQKAMIFKSVFGTETELQLPGMEEEFEGSSVPMPDSGEIREIPAVAVDVPPNDEPTDLLPFGLPAGTYLSMKQTTEPTIIVTSSKNPRMSANPMNVEELSWTIAAKERPDLYPWVENDDIFDRYQAGTVRRITLKVHLTKEASVIHSLSDFRPVPGTSAGTLETLPADVRAKLDKAIKLRKEEMKKATKPGGDPDDPSKAAHSRK